MTNWQIWYSQRRKKRFCRHRGNLDLNYKQGYYISLIDSTYIFDITDQIDVNEAILLQEHRLAGHFNDGA